MNKTIDYQGKRVHYSIEGSGDVLVFIHGYLESAAIWEGFTEKFASGFKVICMDVPGHGESEVLGDKHSMVKLANVLATILDEEKVGLASLFGHSMGGYIVLEFVHLYPERVKAYSLFHSTCFADNEEKKKNREREISLVKCGKKMQIIHTNIPKAFANENITKMPEALARAKEIAGNTEEEGIVALLRGMKDRRDHSKLIQQLEPPLLLINGEKDNYISNEIFNKLVGLAPHATVITLKESGHMGFFEEPDCVYNGIMDFLEVVHKKNQQN